MNVFIVISNVDLGYHVEAVFLDEQKAHAYRDSLARNDSLVQQRIELGVQYPDHYDVIQEEVTE